MPHPIFTRHKPTGTSGSPGICEKNGPAPKTSVSPPESPNNPVKVSSQTIHAATVPDPKGGETPSSDTVHADSERDLDPLDSMNIYQMTNRSSESAGHDLIREIKDILNWWI